MTERGARRLRKVHVFDKDRPCRVPDCPCRGFDKKVRARMDGEERAALERILDDRRCQEIWPQITQRDIPWHRQRNDRARWLVMYAVNAVADQRRTVADKEADIAARKSEKAKKMARKPRPKKRHHEWLELIKALEEVHRYIGRNSTQISVAQFAMHGDHGFLGTPRRWQGVLDEIMKAFRRTHRSLERLDRLLAKPVPASKKWKGPDAAKRHVVLSLYRNMSEKSAGIAARKRLDFTARLASAALNLKDDAALDGVAVRNILAGTRRRGLLRQK